MAMQCSQNMSVFGTITVHGDAYNPIIISDDDHRETTSQAQTSLAGIGNIGNNSSDSSSNSAATPFNPTNAASTTTRQHSENMSAGTTTAYGDAHNSITISDDDEEDDEDVRLFLSAFSGVIRKIRPSVQILP